MPADLDRPAGRFGADGNGSGRTRLGVRGYIAILLAVAIAPVGAVGIVQTVAYQQESRKLRAELIASEAIEATSAGTLAIAETFGVLSTISDLVPIDDGRPACDAFLRKVTERLSIYVASAVVATDGEVLCGSDPDITLDDLGGQDLLDEMVRGQRRLVRSFSAGGIYEDAVLQMSVPLYDGPGLRGFLTLAIPRSFLRILHLGAETTEGEHDALFDRSGYVFATLPAGRSDTDWLPPREKLTEWMRDEAASNGDAIRYTPADGVERAYLLVPVVAPDVFALASWPVAEADAAAATRLALAVIFPIAMWIVGVAIAFFAVNALVLRNLVRLARTMKAFGLGRRSVRMPASASGPVEIETLIAGFNQLAERIERDETALEESIEEKNTLLREVYHRVKNNLQLIVSLLNLQIRQSSTDPERRALRRLQHRVQGLALVHQRLYLAENLSAVRIDHLLDDLIEHLHDANHASPAAVRTDAGALTLEPDRAVPLALFASEALVNAFNHGLRASQGGRVDVRLVRLPDDPEGRERWLLEVLNVVDEEKQAEAQAATAGGLGRRLLESFARQLGGTLSIEVEGSHHRVALSFPREASFGSPLPASPPMGQRQAC